MKVLLDTNILLRVADRAQEDHELIDRAVGKLEQQGHNLFIVPQNIYEYWVVATRPVANNGMGLEPIVAKERVRELTELFQLLRDERGIYSMWFDIVSSQNVRGKTAHDTRLVAAMYRHSISHLLTANAHDFGRYDGISILTPETVVNA